MGTRNGMSTIKFHKRESLISKSNQTRKRLSDFAPQTSYNMARNSYRKGTSLTYELEESRRRLSSLMRTSLPPRLNPMHLQHKTLDDLIYYCKIVCLILHNYIYSLRLT